MTLLSRFRWWRRLRGGEWLRLNGEYVRGEEPSEDDENVIDSDDPVYRADCKRRWDAMWAKLPESERQAWFDMAEKITGKREQPFQEKPTPGITEGGKS